MLAWALPFSASVSSSLSRRVEASLAVAVVFLRFVAASAGISDASAAGRTIQARMRCKVHLVAIGFIESLSIYHHPRDRSSVLDDLVVNIADGARDGHGDQVGQRSSFQHPEGGFASKGASWPASDALQKFFCAELRFVFPQEAKLAEEAERVAAREAIGADAQVYADLLEAIPGKSCVIEITMTAWAMNDRRFCGAREAFEQGEITVSQFIHVHENPLRVDCAGSPQVTEGRGRAAVAHRPTDSLEKRVQGPASFTEHFHFFPRLRHVCRQRH